MAGREESRRAAYRQGALDRLRFYSVVRAAPMFDKALRVIRVRAYRAFLRGDAKRICAEQLLIDEAVALVRQTIAAHAREELAQFLEHQVFDAATADELEEHLDLDLAGQAAETAARARDFCQQLLTYLGIVARAGRDPRSG